MAFPVRTVTQPSVLTGQTNGKLDPAILLDTPAPGVTWPCRLVEPAARSYRALSAAAQRAGHTLKPSGPFDSYRPYYVQERIFLQRFTTNPVSSTRRTWQGETWYLRPGMALAAVPGTSNHGRGIAVDIGEERDGDTGTESIDDGTLRWLLANEERFGFSHEVQSEPWHIRYFAGDHVPQAVTDHERTNPFDEELTMAQFDEIMTKLDHIERALGLRIIELDDDLPENVNDQLGEIRRNLRRTAAAAGVPTGDIES